MMFIEYCLHDHPERVSDELKEVAASIEPGYVADENLARNFARAYAGMTVEEFYDYAMEFGKKKTASVKLSCLKTRASYAALGGQTG